MARPATPRPEAIRLRNSAVTTAVVGGAGLLSRVAGLVVIVQTEMRAEARDEKHETRDTGQPGTVRAARRGHHQSGL